VSGHNLVRARYDQHVLGRERKATNAGTRSIGNNLCRESYLATSKNGVPSMTYKVAFFAECRHTRQEVISAHGHATKFTGLGLILLGQDLSVQVLPLCFGLEHVEEADLALCRC
jgi:hypothetical protein